MVALASAVPTSMGGLVGTVDEDRIEVDAGPLRRCWRPDTRNARWTGQGTSPCRVRDHGQGW